MKMCDAYETYLIYCKDKNIKAIAKKDFFTNTIQGVISKVYKEDGTKKMKGNTQLYDFSKVSLINAIVKTKTLTMDQVEEKITRFALKKPMDEEDDIEPNEYVVQINALREINRKQEEEIERLLELLEKKQKEEKKEEKVVEVVEKKKKQRKIPDDAMERFKNYM
jgi:hypothetical protein